jgi:uncharacterized membrane protein YbhN (UPF0104 family)
MATSSATPATVNSTLPALRGPAPVPVQEPGRSVGAPGEVPGPTGWAIRCVLSVGAATVLLALALPRVAGADWASIGSALTHVGPAGLVLLAAVWLLGLWVHTPALAAAMPGLTHHRALQLNLTGSFVSNLLPLGGAAGTVANWSMARSWGFTSAAFARWAILTNVADTAVKLVTPALALTWLAVVGGEVTGSVSGAAYLGLGLLTAFCCGAWLLGRDDRPARAMGHLADRVCARVGRVPEVPWATRAVGVRHDCASLVGSGWARMVGAKLGYAALQAVLLWLALRLLGVGVAPEVVLAAYAAERILSMVVITPSAAGFVEAGMAGTLVALHTPAAAAAAGVLLYRAFVVGMEIPVGGLWLALWAARRRSAHEDAAPRSRRANQLASPAAAKVMRTPSTTTTLTSPRVAGFARSSTTAAES